MAASRIFNTLRHAMAVRGFHRAPSSSLLVREADHNDGSTSDMFRLRVHADDLEAQNNAQKQKLSLADYHYAFLTSPLFTLELGILQRVGLASPETITREHLFDVAHGREESFGLWKVRHRENRSDTTSVVMRAGTTKPFCDSWWAIEQETNDDQQYELVFGSALLSPQHQNDSSWMVWATTPFHRLYSRLLLASAKETLLSKTVKQRRLDQQSR